MALREFLLPWDSQPQDRVEVDPDIAGRALGVWLPGQGNIAHLQRSGGLLRSDLAAPSVGSDGRVYQTTNTTAQRWVLDSTSSWVPTGGGFSLILRVKFGATIGTGRGFGVRIDGGAAAKRGSINIETGAVILDYGGFGVGSTRLSVATSQTNGTSATFVATTGPRGMEMWRDGVLIASNAANPTRTSDAAMAFALGDLYGGTAGDSEYAVAAAIGAQLEPGLARKYSENWLTLFAPRSIWVPVSASGGSATNLTIQDATHSHTADSLTISLGYVDLTIADATHAHAADSLTLSIVTVTDLTIADATHAHTADNLTISTSGAVSLTIQDATHGHTADSPTVTLGYVDLVIAQALHGHTADSLTLTAEGSVDLAIDDALHPHTADVITLEGLGPDAAGRKKKKRIDDFRFYDNVPLPVEVLTSSIPSDKVVEPIAAPKVEPVPAKASKLAKPKPKKPDAPAPEVKAKAKAPTPKKPAAQVQAPEPVKAVAAPRPMMLSDILSAETMTPEEMIAAVKLLARIQLGPQLIRSTQKAKLIRA